MSIPDWAMRLPLNLIYCKSSDAKLDAMLVAAIIWQESKGFVYAARFEPHFKWTHRPEHYAKFQRITEETEINLQKTSFGLSQLMGGTARWLGFDGALPALYKPENNIFWMCKYLSYLQKKHTDDESVVSSYNQGSPRRGEDGKFLNQSYVDSVFDNYRQLIR